MSVRIVENCGRPPFIMSARIRIPAIRFCLFTFVFASLAFSARAQEQKEAASRSSTSVLVNGQPVMGKVLEVDGKHYVAVEDLAQSLRGTISYGEGQIALTLSPPSSTAAPPRVSQPAAAAPAPPMQPQLPSAAAQPPETGRIQGTLTYFFDFHTGNKPDTGSKVWLVKDHIEIPANKAFVGSSTALGTSENPRQYDAILYSVAGENGDFDLTGISPGQYTLVLQSAHTKGTLKDKRSFFARDDPNHLRDASGRVETLAVAVKAGETVNASKDFGPNMDR